MWKYPNSMFMKVLQAARATRSVRRGVFTSYQTPSTWTSTVWLSAASRTLSVEMVVGEVVVMSVGSSVRRRNMSCKTGRENQLTFAEVG